MDRALNLFGLEPRPVSSITMPKPYLCFMVKASIYSGINN